MSKFTFLRNGVPEDVPPELLQWEAYYPDGTVLKQFDPVTGIFHQFREIDQSRLSAFKMVSTSETYVIPFNPKTMKLIHFYRHVLLDFGGNSRRIKVYVFGYETKVNSKNIKHLIMVVPGGETYIVDSPDVINFK